MPRPVSRAEFEAAIADCAASPAFVEQFGRLTGWETDLEDETFVHDGNLKIKGSWRTPGLCTLVNGHLEVENVLDLNPRWDEGGLFIVIGDLRCRHLIGDIGSHLFVDGDLTARDTAVTGFKASTVSITGTFRTKLFIGGEGHVFVGGGAEIEFGVGHCSAMGELGAPPIPPRKSEKETVRAVTAKPNAKGWLFAPEQFAELIREGRSVFR